MNKKICINNLTDKEILNTRVKDLYLPNSFPNKDVLKVLSALLKDKNIKWRPNYWPSNEWFSPDGIGGFAIPFTLYHPRLIRLEKKIVGFCEGESKKEFLKLICHETGHAIDNAYRLRLLKKRQKIFGLSSSDYPTSYKPNPNTDEYVSYLSDYYAQAHPDEDWAETFAVWLSQPNWKSKYQNLNAILKLEYLDSVMAFVSEKEDFKIATNTVSHSKHETRTVEEVLINKRKSLKLNHPNFYERLIADNFEKSSGVIKAYSFLKNNKKDILTPLKLYSKEAWSIERSFDQILKECKEKKYYLKHTPTETKEIISTTILKNSKQFTRKAQSRIYL